MQQQMSLARDGTGVRRHLGSMDPSILIKFTTTMILIDDLPPPDHGHPDTENTFFFSWTRMCPLVLHFRVHLVHFRVHNYTFVLHFSHFRVAVPPKSGSELGKTIRYPPNLAKKGSQDPKKRRNCADPPSLYIRKRGKTPPKRHTNKQVFPALTRSSEPP